LARSTWLSTMPPPPASRPSTSPSRSGDIRLSHRRGGSRKIEPAGNWILLNVLFSLQVGGPATEHLNVQHFVEQAGRAVGGTVIWTPLITFY
jgi:hypothetical protein